MGQPRGNVAHRAQTNSIRAHPWVSGCARTPTSPNERPAGAHNPKVAGSNPAPAISPKLTREPSIWRAFVFLKPSPTGLGDLDRIGMRPLELLGVLLDEGHVDGVEPVTVARRANTAASCGLSPMKSATSDGWLQL
jgi:hypothetical protein